MMTSSTTVRNSSSRLEPGEQEEPDCSYAVLHGDTTSLVIEVPADGAVPLWRYWGPRLHNGAGDQTVVVPLGPLRAERPTPNFSLDEVVPFSVCPTFGCGWFGQSALLAHRDGGLDYAHNFTLCTLRWQAPEKALTMQLVDAVANIRVDMSLAMGNDDVMTLSSCLTNLGTPPLEVQWLAACALPLPSHARSSVHSFAGRHNREFLPQQDRLGRAIWRKENRRGVTSHDNFPGAVVTVADHDHDSSGNSGNNNAGVCYAAQLAWSGNHVQTIEWLDDGRYQWLLGEWLAPGEIRLETGETYRSPDVLATCSTAGRGGVARQFHRAIRSIMTWPGAADTNHQSSSKPRPVHLNTWEGYFFDHEISSLMKLADVAAQVGIERFVLDDGWFHRRNNDRSSLGDWWADERKYPNHGLRTLADHVVITNGMEFGLWIEPEMVNPDSDLFRNHPDWALQLASRPLITARHQLVLDLSRSDVADYLFAAISKLLMTLPVSYLKWDHNRDLAPAVGRDGRASYHRQVQGAYALLDRVRSAFSAVEIEACAGGGGRIDAAMVRRAHRFWTSDCIDAVSRVEMQRGFLQFLPPEIMGAHIGTAPAHSTGRSQSLDFRAAVALQGHLGVEMDLVQLCASDRDRLAQWIAFYKQWRFLLHDQVWTGDEADSVHWHAAGRNGEWMLLVYRLAPTSWRHAPVMRLPFVKRDQIYAVGTIDPEGSGAPIRANGSWLIEAGLTLPPMPAEHAIIFHISET